jgi:hypothetical protein
MTDISTDSVILPPEPLPWSQSGWFEMVTAWIKEQAVNLNYTLTGAIEQVHRSPTSCVLAVPTKGGTIYFKACAALFQYEPLLTQTISQLLPTYSVRVLRIDNQQAWVIMEDVGSTLRTVMEAERDLKRWEQMVPAFARFQISTIPHIAQLKVVGCPDRTLASIPILFADLLADTATLLVGQEHGVPGGEMDQLQAFKPQLAALCKDLASYNIPETLHHDDLNASNIAVSEDGYVFFDWAESGIAHPFCSLFILLRVAKYIFAFSEDELTLMRNLYLAEWTVYQPMERLLQAFDLAQRLAMLSRCLTWQYVVTHTEESGRAEFADAPAYWLRLFLYNGIEPE